ncbi:hypothetical protein B0H14DRAFT_2581775 [Mycena olivaceomarginata]|nr:hypothetical protein B0H14DRAFT_2581775 [Mycena olivaceomarginata]
MTPKSLKEYFYASHQFNIGERRSNDVQPTLGSVTFKEEMSRPNLGPVELLNWLEMSRVTPPVDGTSVPPLRAESHITLWESSIAAGNLLCTLLRPNHGSLCGAGDYTACAPENWHRYPPSAYLSLISQQPMLATATKAVGTNGVRN